MNEETPKPKRALPAHLAAFKLKPGEKIQKGQKRGAPGTVTPAASPAATVRAANAGAVTTRRVGVLEWLGL